MDIVFHPNRTDYPGKPRGRLRIFNALCQSQKGDWNCKKTASVGDLYLFWFGQSTSTIVGIGVVKSIPEERKNDGWDWTKADRAWFCDFQPLIGLSPQISISNIHANKILSEWWKGSPYYGRPKTIPEKVARQFLNFILKHDKLRATLTKHLDQKAQNKDTTRITGKFHRQAKATSRNALAKHLKQLSKSIGFEDDPRIRRAVESRAMNVVRRYYEDRGFKIEDVHKTQPYDFICKSRHKNLFIEIKGTRNLPRSILLTAGEVRFAMNHEPNMILCIVHSIKVFGKKEAKATGGQLLIYKNWNPDPAKLMPIAFQYSLAPAK